MNSSYINTIIGPLEIITNKGVLFEIRFLSSIEDDVIKDDAVNIVSQLKKYFDGTLKDFDIECSQEGTDFQKKVWSSLVKIPYGKTVSYSTLAQMIDNPKAVRAVGGANNKNKIPIVIPCHRVIGADGSLTGYAGGLEVKKILLKIESSI